MTTDQTITTERNASSTIEAIFWGGVLLWAGFIFGMDYLGYLPQVASASALSWVFLGAGLYALALSGVRLIVDSFPKPTLWDWVWGVILLIMGAAGFLSVQVPWWMILIIAGAALLFSAFRSRR